MNLPHGTAGFGRFFCDPVVKHLSDARLRELANSPDHPAMKFARAEIEKRGRPHTNGSYLDAMMKPPTD